GLTFVEVRDAESGAVTARFGVHDDDEGDTYSGVAISNDGRWAATGSLAGRRSAFWDVAAGTRMRDVGGRRVAIDPAGEFVIARLDGAAWLVAAAAGSKALQLPANVRPVMTPPITNADDGSRSQQTASFDGAANVTSLAVSDDGALVAIATTRWTLV